MKKSLLIVVVLLCLATLMAAMAYNNASITNLADLKVTSTTGSLVGLEPDGNWAWESTNRAGFKDKTAIVKDGELYFEFGKGAHGKLRGLQPNSRYEWIPLFTLRNLSNETVEVTVRAEGPYAEYITFGTTYQSIATASTATANWGIKGEALTINAIEPTLNQGDMKGIRFIAVRIEIPRGETLERVLEGTIIVDSKALK